MRPRASTMSVRLQGRAPGEALPNQAAAASTQAAFPVWLWLTPAFQSHSSTTKVKERRTHSQSERLRGGRGDPGLQPDLRWSALGSGAPGAAGREVLRVRVSAEAERGARKEMPRHRLEQAATPAHRANNKRQGKGHA